MLLGLHLMLVTLHNGLQLVLSTTNRIGDTKCSIKTCSMSPCCPGLFTCAFETSLSCGSPTFSKRWGIVGLNNGEHHHHHVFHCVVYS